MTKTISTTRRAGDAPLSDGLVLSLPRETSEVLTEPTAADLRWSRVRSIVAPIVARTLPSTRPVAPDGGYIDTEGDDPLGLIAAVTDVVLDMLDASHAEETDSLISAYAAMTMTAVVDAA